MIVHVRDVLSHAYIGKAQEKENLQGAMYKNRYHYLIDTSVYTRSYDNILLYLRVYLSYF